MISENDAVKIARQIAEDRSWGWEEPVEVIFRHSWLGKPLRYEVYSNVLKIGAKVKVVIEANTGDILEKGYIRR